MKKPVRYDYSKPIKIISYKKNRFDTIFYSFLLTLMMAAIFYLIFIHDGKFKIDFVLWRVLVSMPLIMLSYWLKGMLDEIRTYTPKLMRKHIWNINELMEMTGKDRKETEAIMNHVLDASFIVDQKNIEKQD